MLRRWWAAAKPSGISSYQTLTGREKFNYSRPGRVWLVTSRLRTAKSQTFFYSVVYSSSRDQTPCIQGGGSSSLYCVPNSTSSLEQVFRPPVKKWSSNLSLRIKLPAQKICWVAFFPYGPTLFLTFKIISKEICEFHSINCSFKVNLQACL